MATARTPAPVFALDIAGGAVCSWRGCRQEAAILALVVGHGRTVGQKALPIEKDSNNLHEEPGEATGMVCHDAQPTLSSHKTCPRHLVAIRLACSSFTCCSVKTPAAKAMLIDSSSERLSKPGSRDVGSGDGGGSSIKSSSVSDVEGEK